MSGAFRQLPLDVAYFVIGLLLGPCFLALIVLARPGERALCGLFVGSLTQVGVAVALHASRNTPTVPPEFVWIAITAALIAVAVLSVGFRVMRGPRDDLPPLEPTPEEEYIRRTRGR